MKALITSLFLLLIFSSNAIAGPVYSWEDADGVMHFSSKKSDPRAKPADLPEINRGDVKLVKRKLKSCSEHGGIDCQAGADNDGSVICYDGFRGASPLYRFSCNAPKLKITQISDVDQFGTFSVMVRNAKSVTANSPALIFSPTDGSEVSLTGPEKIEAFGVAEFRFEPKDADIPTGPVTLANLRVECANCP